MNNNLEKAHLLFAARGVLTRLEMNKLLRAVTNTICRQQHGITPGGGQTMVRNARRVLASTLRMTPAARALLEESLLFPNAQRPQLNLDHVYEVKEMLYDISVASSPEAVLSILEKTDFCLMTEQEHLEKTYR